MTSLDLQNAQRLESEQANHAITTLRKNGAFFLKLKFFNLDLFYYVTIIPFFRPNKKVIY